VRGKRILLALALLMLSVVSLQLLLCPTSLDRSTTGSDPIEETVADSVAHSAFLSQFYENIGQVNAKDVMFYGRMPGGMIGFGESRIHLWMEGTDSCVFLSFVGAGNVTPIGMDEVSRHTSYFLGDRGTYTGVRGYSQIAYEDLWPGIDLYYRAKEDGVKYEFRVEAGRDPTNIRVRCEGHDSLVIGESVVSISKDNGAFVDEGLQAFQELTDTDVTFSSCGPHTYGFKVSNYDGSKDLIIDPLVYSTFVGGEVSEGANSIAVDSFGNAFVTGITESHDFPTVNAYNSTHGDGWDCFVFKLSASGSSLLYSTFIGGRGYDYANSIAVDSPGNAFVTGRTGSSDFPTVNAYNSTHGDGWDCFVFKLSADGSNLLYSTFVGGREYDEASSIALDSSGNAFVTGLTRSLDFPTMNAYDNTHGDGRDCFVFKLSADGSNLLYSTFVGGSSYDEARSVAVDSSGNAFVTGYTFSFDFPTVNAYDSTRGGDEDCFVFKLSASGSTLLYSTFIGGRSYDYANSIAVDSPGNAFVTGRTGSSDFPTVNAYDSTHGGDEDCFVFKLSASGSTLLYSTFIGGRSYDYAFSIAVDWFGNAFVAGGTESHDFPTVNAYDSTYGDNGDCFVFKLSASGSTLLYSTFVGGSWFDYGNSIVVDSFGNAFVAGGTESHDFPTVNAYNSTHGDGWDCFVFELSSGLYYAVGSRILQFLLYIHLVISGAINLIALGLVLFTSVHLVRMLISRPTTSATYLYGPQHAINPEVLRCQNCDRDFESGMTKWPEEPDPIPIVHVSVAYTLLSRLRESRLNIFRRKKESE
jgi:hypothetical protein